MRVLPRLAAAAAALLLLASPLSATLPGGTSWTLTGISKVTTSGGGATHVEKGYDTAHLGTPAPGAFTLNLESEPERIYEGTLVEAGRTTLLAVDQASRDSFLADLVQAIESTGVTVVEYGQPVWVLRARPVSTRTGEEMRLKASMRWRVLTEYQGRRMRIGVRLSGNYRGTEDA